MDSPEDTEFGKLDTRERSLLEDAIKRSDSDGTELSAGDLLEDAEIRGEVSAAAEKVASLTSRRTELQRRVALTALVSGGTAIVGVGLTVTIYLHIGQGSVATLIGAAAGLATAFAATVAVGTRRQRIFATETLEKLEDSASRSISGRIIDKTTAAANQALAPENQFFEATDESRLVELGNHAPSSNWLTGYLEDFIANHVSSAIGVAGPRGVGKSAALRSICGQRSHQWIGVYIESPVVYEPSDFVRLIHAKVAEAMLEDEGAGDLGLSIVNPARVMIGLFAALVLYAGLGLVVLGLLHVRFHPSPLLVTGVILIAASLILVVSQSRALSRRAIYRGSPSETATLAAEALAGLRWTSSSQWTRNISLGVASTASIGGTEQHSATRQERNHPERVEDFKHFVRQYADLHPEKPLVIAIDELDKLSTREEILSTINGMKDILHLERVHFLVSVSEDALSAFADRGVPLRDAFDSSFDEMVLVRRITVDEAVQLLDERTRSFPLRVALVCYALSGGIPRDLIRSARCCVRMRREMGGPILIDDVIHTLIKDEILSVINGAAIRAREEGDSSDLNWILNLRRTLSLESSHFWDPLFIPDECLQSIPVTEGQPGWQRFIPSLGAYLETVGMVYELFSEGDQSGFVSDESESTYRDVATHLAHAIAAVALAPEEVRWHLASVRPDQLAPQSLMT